MNDSNPEAPTGRFPTFKLLFHWLFNWRKIRACLFALVCLATIVALLYAEENSRGARAEAKYRRELEAKGESLDYRRFVPAPVPDEQNFAETPFFAPLFDFLPGTQKARDTNAWQRSTDFGKGFPGIPQRVGWEGGKKIDLIACHAAFEEARKESSAAGAMSPTQAAEAILQDLKEYDPVLNELRAASHRPHSRFNLNYELDNPAGIFIPHLAKVKSLCLILKLRAAAELELGRIEPAAGDVDLMLCLTDSIKNEPILISHLVRIACLQISMQAVWEGLVTHKWPDAQLQTWQARLQQFDFISDLQFAFRAERAWGNRIIDWVKNGRRPGDYFSALTAGNDDETLAAFAFSYCPRGWFDFEKLGYYRLFEDSTFSGFDAHSRRINPSVSVGNQERLEKSLGGWAFGSLTRHRVFARLLIPAIVNVHRKFALAQTIVDETGIACALERYRLANGQYPEKLEVLVPRFLGRIPNDVISGGPLRYGRPDGAQFVLYSVGWNEKDDGGTAVPAKGKSPALDFTQGDWVWQFPAGR